VVSTSSPFAPRSLLFSLLAFFSAGCSWDHILGFGPEAPEDAAIVAIDTTGTPNISAVSPAADSGAGQTTNDASDGGSADPPDASDPGIVDSSTSDGIDVTADTAPIDGSEDSGSDSVASDARGDSGSADVASDISVGGSLDGGLDAPESGALDAGGDSGAGSLNVTLSNPMCSFDGWCWTTPLPQGNWLGGVWAAAANDVWAVGGDETILHFDGNAWSGTAIGPPPEIIPLDDAGSSITISERGLSAIAGSGPKDIWAVGGQSGFGGGEILHFDGTKWSRDPGSSLSLGLSAVWVGGPSEAWAVGRGVDPQRGTFLHWNGTAWSAIETGKVPGLYTIFPSSVWGSGPNDIWSVGTTRGAVQQGHVFHYDGSSWTESLTPGGHSMYFTAVWGTSPTDVWIGEGSAFNTKLEHWDGSSWTTTFLTSTASYVGAFAGQGPNDVWLTNQFNGGAWHFDGQTWQLMPGAKPANGLWELGSGDIWGVGSVGQIEHFDGSTWSQSPAIAQGLYGVWGASETDVWAAGAVLLGPTSQAGALVHWDGLAWSVAMTIPTVTELAGLWGTGTDVWAVGRSGTIVHRSGVSFTTSNPTTANLHGVGGTSTADIWAVGAAGTILHSSDGTSWVTSPSNSTVDLTSVWATAPDDAWAVGAGGTILHWDGQVWGAAVTGTSSDLNAVWASGSNNVWAVGAAGAMLHWNGSLWSTTNNVTMGYLYGVWGTASNDVWITGDGTYHWNGSSWKRSDTGTTSGLRMQAGWSNGRAAFIVNGSGGAALEKRFAPAL